MSTTAQAPAPAAQPVQAKKVDLDALLALTTANVVKTRGASGNTTYLDRFVSHLIDKDGNVGKRHTRVELIALISRDIVLEANPDFSLESKEDLALFAETNKKVKAMVAAAVSDSQNSTALSFNDKYKDTYRVVKDGKYISLEMIKAEQPAAK